MKHLVWIPLFCALAFAQGGKVGPSGVIGPKGIVSSAATFVAGVAFDAVGPSASGTKSTAGNSTWTTFTLSWTHVCGASANGLVVGAGYIGAAGAPDIATLSVTAGGTGMTSVGSVNADNTSGQGLIQLFKLPSCTSSSLAIVVTATYVSGTKDATDTIFGGSVSFTGVSGFGTAPTPTFGSSASVSCGVVSSASSHMVVDVMGTGTAYSSSSGTNRWHASTTSLAMDAVAQSTYAGASSVTPTYVVTNDSWGCVDVDVQ